MRGQTSTDPAAPPTWLALDHLVPSATNPRRSNRAAADDELLESIRQRGILTPLLVRCIEHDEQDTYEIVAGHRRFAAAQELGLTRVPVVVRALSDEEAAQVAIVENLQREDIAPLDEAEAYDRLLLQPGVTVTEVAAQVGKSPADVGRRLKLLHTVQAVRDALREGRLDVARAELLAKLTPELQEKALKDNVVWSPFYSEIDDAHDVEHWTAENLTPIRRLREWVDARQVLKLADLAVGGEARELFPEAAEAIDATIGATIGATADMARATMLEVALDRFQRSPAKDTIPADVLQLGKHFRQVVGKPCKQAEKAIVVFGEMRGEVVTVCRAKKACQKHWPPAEAKPTARTPSTPPRRSWEEEEAERKRQQEIFEAVKPDLVKAIVAATAKVQTTPKLLQDVLESAHFDSLKPTLNVIGKLTPATFGRAWVLADALSGLYNVRGAEEVCAGLKVKFDLKNAMKEAEAKLRTAAAAKATSTKKAPAKKGRAA